MAAGTVPAINRALLASCQEWPVNLTRSHSLNGFTLNAAGLNRFNPFNSNGFGEPMTATDSICQQLREIVGPGAYAKLQAAYGGGTLKPPMTTHSREFRHLACVVGADAAETIIEKFGGTVIYIANGKQARNMNESARRNAEICAEYDELTKTHASGEAVRRLSIKHGLSNRYIYMVLKRIW